MAQPELTARQKRDRRYAKKHAARIRAQRKIYREANREKIREYLHAYRQRSGMKGKAAAYHRAYKPLYQRQRDKTDIHFRLRRRLQSRILIALRAIQSSKHANTLTLIGCTVAELKTHIESRWQSGMSWENYGVYRRNGPMTWHIDHIRPCASFDLTDPEQQKACFHYTNLQPLWAIDNIRKRDNHE